MSQVGKNIILTSILALFLLDYNRNQILYFYQQYKLENMGCTVKERVSDINSLSTGCGKLWVHRVNSVERFHLLKNHFEGFESDIVFDPVSRQFNVHHPPEISTGLTLEIILREFQISSKKYWLDTKLVDDTHINEMVEEFIRLDRIFDIKQNGIIESSNYHMVNLLAEYGFVTSYLFSPAFKNEGSGSTGQGDLITGHLNDAVKYVSGDSFQLDNLKRQFPGRKILLWSLTFKNFIDAAPLKELMNDPDVSVILVNIKTDYYK